MGIGHNILLFYYHEHGKWGHADAPKPSLTTELRFFILRNNLVKFDKKI